MTAGRKSVSDMKDWCTPGKYVAAVKDVFGGKIELDPCSSKYSIVGAENEYLLPKQDGLSLSWEYKSIYVNPPYGNDKERGTTIRHWLRKIAETRGNCDTEIIALIPVATNTRHWKEYVYPKAAAISFLYDTRLKFIIAGDENTKGAPMSCACVYYGSNVSRFIDVFSQHGATLPLHGIRFPESAAKFNTLSLFDQKIRRKKAIAF